MKTTIPTTNQTIEPIPIANCALSVQVGSVAGIERMATIGAPTMILVTNVTCITHP